MGSRWSGKCLILGLGVLIASTYCLANTVIDDFDDGNSKSKIQKYWYFYTDVDNDGTSTIYGVAKNPEFAGEYDGKDGTYGAAMEFNLGDTSGMSSGCKPYVAMGLNFAEGTSTNGRYPYDLTGADSISFYVKGDKAFTARLYMELTTVKNWDDYFYAIDVTTSWQHVTIAMKKDSKKGFKQNGWDDEYVAFDLTQIAKMNFRVRWDENPDLEDGTLYIDSIVMHGNAKFPKQGTINPEDVGSLPSSECLLNNFADGKKKNTLGFSWFTYTDNTIEGTSVFTAGYDDDTKNLELDATGGYDNTEGISISVKLGDMIPNSSDPKNPIAPFVGIGTTLGDETNGFFNAGGGTGIYLNYKSDIEVELELVDTTSRTDGMAFHVVLPTTQGEWKQINAPFSAFVLPDWVNKADLTTAQAELNETCLSKLQIKISGDAKADGNFSLDNIYFDGVSIVSVLPLNQKIYSNGISFVRNRDAIKINFNNLAGSASVSLLNPMGKIVNLQKLNNRFSSCSIPLSGKASGVYILKIAGSSGLIQTRSIHIVK